MLKRWIAAFMAVAALGALFAANQASIQTNKHGSVQLARRHGTLPDPVPDPGEPPPDVDPPDPPHPPEEPPEVEPGDDGFEAPHAEAVNV